MPTQQVRSLSRTLISGFLSFLLCLCVFFMSVAVLLGVTLFNGNYMLNQFASSYYYSNIAGEIREQYAAYGLPGGIEESFFDEVIDENALYHDISQSVEAAYAGDTYALDTIGIKTDLYQKLVDYATAKQIPVDETLQESLSHLADLCVESYVARVNNPYLLKLGEIAHRLARVPLIAGIVCFLIAGGLFVFLYFLHQWKHRPIRYLQYALIGSGLMLLILPAAALISGKVQNLGITSPALFKMMTSYVNNVLWAFVYTGLGWILIAGTVGWIVYKMVKQQYL